MTPLLKQFGELTAEDFERHPVWIGCHVVDHDEDWYDETDEATCRPLADHLPQHLDENDLWVSASFVIADGTVYKGMLKPPPRFIPPELKEILANFYTSDPLTEQIGKTQPVMFAPSGEQISFWYGVVPLNPSEKRRIYESLAKNAAALFPIHVQSVAGLLSTSVSIRLEGFYLIREPRVVIEI